MEEKNNNNTFAEVFVDRLLTEGSKTSCDETNKSFDNDNLLPPFYDEELFRRGQRFFYKHIFAMFAAKLYGLLAVLAIPSILRILMFTKMSGSESTAYKRYMATVFHMMIWYDESFHPGSRLWKSISEVKRKHNSASKKSCNSGINRISQQDMALTQFGFMGFAVTRSEAVGIHGATKEELEAFIHLWRVVGFLMGIEDRFNICSGSVEETKTICSIIIARAFKPQIEKRDKNFLSMCYYLCNGLWTMDPMLHYKPFMCNLYNLVQESNNNITPNYFRMTLVNRFNFQLHQWVFYSLKFNVLRIYHNQMRVLSLWIMKVFPFLAYYKFGVKDAIVKI